MQAGRELDLKVAKALGWKVSEGDGIFCDEDGHVIDEPKFSTTWEGMGLLVEEAMQQRVAFQLTSRFMEGEFIDYHCMAATAKDLHSGVSTKAPHAACMAFLKAKGIEI